jgi:cell wall-associated NlpC family hydrolase
MKKFFAICLISCLVLLPGWGEDDGLGTVYHSIKRLEKNVRNAFTEDSEAQPNPTPRRHRKSATRHSSSSKAKSKHSDSQDSDASNETSKSKSASESSTEVKQDGPQPDVGEDKTGSNPATKPTIGEGAGTDSENNAQTAAPMATIKPEAIREFPEQPTEVQELIRNALALTEKNLSYKYGSADPASGGMDCSGFIYYVLSNAGYKDVPRDSAGQYEWVRKNSDFHAVLSRSGESFELNDLKPGDLLFWSGTYKVDRDIPISHVMIYLGKEKSTDKPVMVGATDGRSYEGIRRFGVSVFDFKMPSGKPNKGDPDLTAKFEGYASIPGLRQVDVASKNQANREQEIKGDLGKPGAKARPATNTMGDGD